MKKQKRTRIFAFVLAMLQVVLLAAFFTVSTSAAQGNPRSYYFPYIEDAKLSLVMDGAPLGKPNGVADESFWDDVPYVKFNGYSGTLNDAKLKGVMTKDASNHPVLFLYMEYTDTTVTTASDWMTDGFIFCIAEDGTNSYRTGTTATRAANATNYSGSISSGGALKYGYVNNRATAGKVTLEFMYTFAAVKDTNDAFNFRFNVMLQDNYNETSYYRAYFSGNTGAQNAKADSTDGLSQYAYGYFNNTTFSAVVSAGKAVTDRNSYTFYPTEETITLDGNPNENIWSAVPASDFTTANAGISKPMIWGCYKTDGSTTTVYIMIRYTDTTDAYTSASGQSWQNDGFIICMDETAFTDATEWNTGDVSFNTTTGSTKQTFRTGTINYAVANNGKQLNNGGTYGINYGYQYHPTDGGYVSVEIAYTFKSLRADNTFRFNLLAQNYANGGKQAYWSSSSHNDIRRSGDGILATTDGVKPIMLAGAGMRLVSEENKCGLRFATRIDKAAYDALIAEGKTIQTGTFILPQSELPGTLTYEALDAMTYNNDEEDNGEVTTDNRHGWEIVNDAFYNADTADASGYYLFYGSLVGIKTANITRKFVAVSYVAVTDGGETTYYLSDYNAADHARSIKEVATRAKASGMYSAYSSLLDQYIAAT